MQQFRLNQDRQIMEWINLLKLKKSRNLKYNEQFHKWRVPIINSKDNNLEVETICTFRKLYSSRSKNHNFPSNYMLKLQGRLAQNMVI